MIVIDNAKDGQRIASDTLERSVTDKRLSYRLLGQNKSITREQNNVLFVITSNNAALSPDLHRRHLPIQLATEKDPSELVFPVPDIVDFTAAHRKEILSSLAGMVQVWIDRGMPIPDQPVRHSQTQAWALVMDGILRANRYAGFLENFEPYQATTVPKPKKGRDKKGSRVPDCLGKTSVNVWIENCTIKTE